MNKRERKGFLRAREEAAQVAFETTRERQIGEDVSWRGCGHLLLQVTESSSFEPAHIWDIRAREDVLNIYVSVTNPEKPGFLMPGYHALACDAAVLRAHVNALEDVEVRSPLRFTAPSGLDGTTYTLRRNSGFASVTFRWWSKGPSEWNELVQRTASFIAFLKTFQNAP